MNVDVVRFRLICLNPPDGEFGLQDDDERLYAGETRDDGARVYEFTLRTKAWSDTWTFSGAFTHGAPKDRFLYLSLRAPGGSWVKRLKVPLMTITAEQVLAGGVLEGVVNGQGAATVMLLNGGWQARADGS